MSGMSVPEFAALLDEKPQRLKDVLAERQKLPEDMLVKILVKTGVDANWLVLGSGKASDLADDEQMLLMRYRSSPQGLRDAAVRVLLGDKASGAMIFKGSVGQSVKVEGNLDQTGITFDMGKGKKK